MKWDEKEEIERNRGQNTQGGYKRQKEVPPCPPKPDLLNNGVGQTARNLDAKMRTIRGQEISFKKYLELGSAKGDFGDTPENDFAGDALSDEHFRDDFKTWDELELYLLVCKACPEALEAAQNLFKKWQAGK